MDEKNYELKTCLSKVENDQIEGTKIEGKIKEIIENGYIICWLHYAVLIGKIVNNEFVFNNGEKSDLEKYLERLRAFNQQKEIFIWKSGNKFKYRIRIEEKGKENDYIDAQQVLWGTNSIDLKNGFNKVFEDRGIELILPQEILNGKEINKKNRLILVTRNYIDYNEIGQAGFIDSRFKEIKVEEIKDGSKSTL